MTTVTISAKFQVVIPNAVRDALELRPGQRMQAIEYDGRVELIPLEDAHELRGFVHGLDTTLAREADRT